MPKPVQNGPDETFLAANADLVLRMVDGGIARAERRILDAVDEDDAKEARQSRALWAGVREKGGAWHAMSADERGVVLAQHAHETAHLRETP